MRVIVITEAEFQDYEPERIVALLDSGAAWRVHIRKPGCEEGAMRRLIETIPERLYQRLSLNDCQWLAADYGLGGVHLNGRCHAAPVGFVGLKSRSCHSVEEAECFADETDYRFLSPVFDSISKQGYSGRFSEMGADAQLPPDTFALGGVTPARFGELAAMGFAGAALLGYVWSSGDEGRFENVVREILSEKSKY